MNKIKVENMVMRVKMGPRPSGSGPKKKLASSPRPKNVAVCAVRAPTVINL